MTTTDFGYTFRTTPRSVQVADLERSWLRPAWARFWEMRVGKGVQTCYEMDALATLRGVRRFLVVCPKRVLGVWEEMIRTHTGLRATRTPAVPPNEGVYLVNYERIWTRDKRGRVVVDPMLVAWSPEFVVADEAHFIKNRRSARSRAMHLLARLVPIRRALTGTPDPKSYADYWSIYAFLDPKVFGSWTAFAQRYLLLDFWKQVVGYQRVEELAAKIHSLASRARRADYFDIPEVEVQTVPVALPPSARSVYKEMARCLFVELSELPKETSSAPITLTKLLRLAQIAGGHVTINEDGAVRWLHDAKIEALLDVLDSVLADEGAQAVVFARFRAEIERIVAVLQKRKIRTAELTGSTTNTEAVLRTFREKKADVLVAQIAAGGLGIDLSNAETAIFYSWDFDAASYQQARDRIWKEGGKITIVRLVAEHTVDEVMLRVVDEKLRRSALVLDNWEEIVNGTYK